MLVKIIRNIIFLITLILASCWCCSCGSEEMTGLVILKGMDDSSFTELSETANVWGDEKNIQITVEAPETSSIDSQVTILEEALSKGEYEFIIIDPQSGAELYPLIDYAQSQGITVVSMNGTDDIGASYNILPQTEEEIGTLMMDEMATLMGETGSIATVIPELSNDLIVNQEAATINCQEYMYGNMFVVSRNKNSGSISSAYSAVDELYTAYGMSGVLFYTEADGIGISRWQEDMQTDLIVVGVGNLEDMEIEEDDLKVDVLFTWNRQDLLSVSLDVALMDLKGNIETGAETIQTSIEGYKTMRLQENGSYVGSAVETLYLTE